MYIISNGWMAEGLKGKILLFNKKKKCVQLKKEKKSQSTLPDAIMTFAFPNYFLLISQSSTQLWVEHDIT